MPGDTDLSGRRILVVEDDFFQASDTDRVLREAGAEVVGPIPRSKAALDVLAEDGIDAAVIDINLGEGANFDVADALKAAGVPFLFVTGYDATLIPERLADIVTILKPADMNQVARALKRLLTGDRI